MPRTGFHVGLGSGYEQALEQLEKTGATTAQIFTHSPRMFKFKELDPARQQVLLDGWKKLGISPVVSHASYLINIAALDNQKFYGALGVLQKELEYAAAFGCDYVVLHSGKFTQATYEEGVAQIAKGLTKLLPVFEKTNVKILLEIAAGQGSEIGKTFSELKDIIDAAPAVSEYLGVCLDTCHLFAAGYDIGNPDEIVQEIEKTIGFSRIKVLHVNDSKFPLSSHRDRHEHIGLGEIGTQRFTKFLTHEKFSTLPMILETPIEDKRGHEENLLALRKIVG